MKRGILASRKRLWKSLVVCALFPWASTSENVASVPDEAHAASNVVTVDHVSWDDVIIGSSRPSFVFFHSSLSQDAMGAISKELSTLSRKYDGVATVATVDCGRPEVLDAVCREKAAVAKVPHMRVYAAERRRNPYQQTWYKEFRDYDGGMDARAMSQALQAQLNDDNIARIDSMRQWENWVDEGTLPQVLVFSNKAEPSILLKGLSMHFGGRLAFAHVSGSLNELRDELAVDTVPAVAVRKRSGDVSHYAGAFNAADLAEYLTAFAPEKLEDEVNRKNLEATAPIFERPPRYRNLTLLEMDTVLRDSEDIWVLAVVQEAAFLGGPGGEGALCADAAAEFLAMAEAVGEMVHVGLVTVTSSDVEAPGAMEGLGSRDGGAVCTLAAFVKPFGEGVGRGELRPLQGVLDERHVLATVYPEVPELTTHVSSETLPAFMGMQPGGVGPFTPKIILATAKHEAPPLFRLVAANFRHRDLAFGWFSPDLDPRIAEEFRVPRLPFILAVHVDPSAAPNEAGQVPVMVDPFAAPMRYTYIANFIEAVAARHGRGAAQGGESDDTQDFSGPSWRATGPITAATSDAELSSACVARGGVCLLAFLDGAATDIRAELEILQGIKSVRRDQPLQFVWVDAPRQPDFTKAFLGLSAPLPAAALLSPRKLRFAAHTGAFTADALSAWISRMLGGQVATMPLGSIPNLVEGGVQSQRPAPTGTGSGEEDEFDLSEIMATDVAGADLDRDARLLQADAEAEEELKRRAEEAAKTKLELEQRARKKKKKKKAKKKGAKQEPGAQDEL